MLTGLAPVNAKSIMMILAADAVLAPKGGVAHVTALMSRQLLTLHSLVDNGFGEVSF